MHFFQNIKHQNITDKIFEFQGIYVRVKTVTDKIFEFQGIYVRICLKKTAFKIYSFAI